MCASEFWCAASWSHALDERDIARADINRYDELIYAVGMKFNGESRHETALRYIREAENIKTTQAAMPNAS
mgnify:FL=1